MLRPDPDPVHQALTGDGFGLTPVPLMDDYPDGLLAGYAFERGGAEIVYNLRDPETVIVYRLRRVDDRRGLRSAFGPLVWFLEYLHDRPELGIKRAMGLVRTKEFAHLGGLDEARLKRYLIRWLGGRFTKVDFTNDWLYLDLVDFRATGAASRRPPRAAGPSSDSCKTSS